MRTDPTRSGIGLRSIQSRRALGYVALLMALGLVASACGSSDGSDSTGAGEATATTHDEAIEEGSDHAEEFEFGEQMDAADASRIIYITATDSLTFEPASVTVSAGETVTFEVTNAGVLPHDFTLGDAEMQEEHGAEMAEMTGAIAMHDEPNAFGLEAGETKKMTWQFTAPGEILFGCHVPGHYAAGMKGTLSIEG